MEFINAAAKKIRTGIIEEARKLRHFPESKPILPDTEEFNPPVRYTKKWSYKIIFSIFQKKKQVRINTIRHDKDIDEFSRYLI